MSQKYCACHTKPLSTHYKTRLNVTKCHACHANRSNATFETSQNDPFWRTYHGHGHIAIARTVANGCGMLRTVADGCERLRTVANSCGRKRNVERTHPQPPDPQSETGTLATHSGKMSLGKLKLKLFEEGCLQVGQDQAKLQSAMAQCFFEESTIKL